jgi:hypothetical protein
MITEGIIQFAYKNRQWKLEYTYIIHSIRRTKQWKPYKFKIKNYAQGYTYCQVQVDMRDENNGF